MTDNSKKDEHGVVIYNGRRWLTGDWLVVLVIFW